MKLQVLIGDKWCFVFCRNGAEIVVTKDSRKALGRDALLYFQENFANHVFRIERG